VRDDRSRLKYEGCDLPAVVKLLPETCDAKTA
jgi:hypothetical protein